MISTNEAHIRANARENTLERVGDGTAVTADQFRCMGYGDRVELFRVNPDAYRALLRETEAGR